MKIRQGFVSNSSSSSFIVAFPKKPKDAKDVLRYMFDGKEGGVGMDCYSDGLSYAQIADIVFKDIDDGNAKFGALKVLIDNMKNRYHYNSNRGTIHILSGEYDEDGGSWSYKRGRYFGFDKKLMEEFKKAVIEEDEKDEELREKERNIFSKANIKRSKYAYKGGIDPYTQKPYTNEEIKAHEKCEKTMEEFRNTNPEYLSWEKERNKFFHEKWEKQDGLREKLAKIDAQNFLDDNKGKYIFVVEYGDEDDWQGGTMEHGNIFRNVPHIQISNH